MKFKKNPKSLLPQQIIEHISDIVDLKELHRGREGEAYYFVLHKNTHIFNELLKPGEYVIKIYSSKKGNPRYLNDAQQFYLKLLSRYGLIPKIFYLDSNVMIMKYVKGIKLRQFLRKHPKKERELTVQYKKLLDVWKKLGFYHGDILQSAFEHDELDNYDDPDWINTPNALVSHENGKIKLYFIDPYTDHLNKDYMKH